MCFSAGASFTGGIIISVIGVATLTRVHKPSQLVFACIPLFFGVQQFTEGMVWLSINVPEYAGYQKMASQLFLFMADALWPSLIPLSVLLMEENVRKRKSLWLLLMAGLIVSVYYAFCLIFLNVTPRIMGYHIKYFTDFPESLAIPALALYLLATLPPLFISSIKRVYIMGMLMFFSCLVTAIFFTQFLLSVWCFFAAFISGVIYWILSESKKKFHSGKLDLLRSRYISLEE